MAAPSAQQQLRLIKRVKPILFVAFLLPLVAIVYQVNQGRIAEPVDALTHVTGEWSLRLLILTLMITPLRWITGWNGLIRVRRMIGLFAFFYALVHAGIWLVLDQDLSVSAIATDIIKRKYIFVGFASFIIMLVLAVTSPAAMVRKLGGRVWQKLHRWVYVAAIGAALHFIWSAKAEHAEPFVYAAVIAILLIARWIHHRRQTAKRAAAGPATSASPTG